jgi:hypothetical protein
MEDRESIIAWAEEGRPGDRKGQELEQLIVVLRIKGRRFRHGRSKSFSIPSGTWRGMISGALIG